MNCCLGCGNDELFCGTVYDTEYVLCACCGWCRLKQDYHKVAAAALEEALDES